MAKEIVGSNEGLTPSLHWPRYADPIHQGTLWVPERLYPWQVQTLRLCSEWGSRVALVTPNESGKSAVLIPVLGLSFMAAFPGAQVVTTAGVERQIKKQLWPKLEAAVRKYPDWRITSGDELKIKAPSIRGLPGSTWEAFSAKDPEYAEGFHPRWYRDQDGVPVYAPLMIIVDEAKSFNDYEMMFAFVNRCSPDILLLASTPGDDAGPFFDAFNKDRGRPWKCVEVGWDDCPHLKQGFKLQERLDAIDRFGENNPLVQSWVFGKFSRRGGRFVFDDMASVDEAMSGRLYWVKGRRSAALDFSGGGDEQVLGVSLGNMVLPFEVYHEKDDTVLCDILEERLKFHGLKGPDIIADNGGAGKTCIDMLERRGFYGIQRYMFNGEPRDKRCFKYRSAEDAWEVKRRMKMRGLILPNDMVLKEEIRKRQYEVVNDDNVIRLEQKEKLRNRGESSPNRLDVLEMLVSDMAENEWTAPRNKRQDISICGSTEDCFRPGPKVEEMGGAWASGMYMDD